MDLEKVPLSASNHVSVMQAMLISLSVKTCKKFSNLSLSVLLFKDGKFHAIILQIFVDTMLTVCKGLFTGFL